MRALRLAEPAERDIADILDDSLEHFGTASRRRYEILIGTALRDLIDDPARRGSHDLAEASRPALRSYHLRYSRERARDRGGSIGRPRHLLIYTASPDAVVILRVLHDAMDLARHLPDDLS